MGFFGRLFSAGPALNRVAKTFDECFNALRRYDVTSDKNELRRAMWLFVYGVQGSLEKWHWNPYSASIYIPNHMELGRIKMYQAIMLFMDNISQRAQSCGMDEEITSMIDDEDVLNCYSTLVSRELKNKLEP